MSLEPIRTLVKHDLQAIDHFIVSQLDSNISLIKQIIEYVLTCGGKRVRPLVLILSSHALSYHHHKHIDLAAVIELIHTATLLHDDVVDSSTLRRGHKTAHTIWGNQASVLVGDFLYSRAFQIVVDLKNDTILDLFAKATHYIAEGEIMQLVNCNNPDTTENFYFEIIQRKTAKLFEMAAQLGAILATTSEAAINAFKDFGRNLGLAYQLIDDVLDYSKSAEQTGKNIGQDITEGKATLPFIYAMQKAKGADLKLLRNAISKGSTKHLDTIIQLIQSSDALKNTTNAAKEHIIKAKEALTYVPQSEYRGALEQLSDFVVSREY